MFTMSNFSVLDQIISVEDMIRNYRQVFDKVKLDKKPMIILRRNYPDVALVDVTWLRETERKLHDLTEKRILKIVTDGRNEHKNKKTKVLKSIVRLMKNANN